MACLGLLAGAAGAGAVYQWLAEAGDRRRFRPPGRLVEVGGRRLHLADRGSGSPAVVIVPALGANTLEYLGIQRELAARTRVCVYDRAGLGWSDPPPRGRRTVDDLAGELAELLRAACVGPPYVLVGHSMGGVIVRRFAARYPGAVAAVLLLDSAHEDQAARLHGGSRRRGVLASWALVARWRASIPGLRRLAATAGLMPRFESAVAREVPPERAAAARAIYLSSRQRRAMARETLMMTRSRGRPASLGALPLTVLTAAGRDGSWMRMQAELAALSSDTKHITARTAGHDIHLDEPYLVIQAVYDLIARWGGAG